MEQEDMAVLSPQAQEIYMAYQRRFGSDDWKSLVEWASEMLDKAEQKQLAAPNWDAVQRARGEKVAWFEIINLEASTENQFLAMVEEAKALAAAQTESEYE